MAEHVTSPLTLVSGLFDVASREHNPQRPGPEDYWRWGACVLDLDCDIVFFCDPVFEPQILKRRAERGHARRTVVIPVSLEELKVHTQLRAIEAARGHHPLINGSPTVDTPLYVVLQ